MSGSTHSAVLSVAWVAVTKYCRPCGLNIRRLFLTVLEAGKFNIMVWAHSVSGKGPLPVLPATAFLLYPHLVERDLWALHLLTTVPVSSWGLHPFKSNYLPKASPPNTITLETGVSMYTFLERHKHSICCLPLQQRCSIGICK